MYTLEYSIGTMTARNLLHVELIDLAKVYACCCEAMFASSSLEYVILCGVRGTGPSIANPKHSRSSSVGHVLMCAVPGSIEGLVEHKRGLFALPSCVSGVGSTWDIEYTSVDGEACLVHMDCSQDRIQLLGPAIGAPDVEARAERRDRMFCQLFLISRWYFVEALAKDLTRVTRRDTLEKDCTLTRTVLQSSSEESSAIARYACARGIRIV